ncbi:hypothetical protein BFW01_g79 [Lasiodiplodia theobromae]|uniref:Uncharacterized protein n=1 Tax=Lasiodiplodia theobromae TaxID=45133 RepID=A0A8H7IQ40_9PEZI|nr:hypothetical protein BFW01_g79 [Lasiodiplodia theobromae]
MMMGVQAERRTQAAKPCGGANLRSHRPQPAADTVSSARQLIVRHVARLLKFQRAFTTCGGSPASNTSLRTAVVRLHPGSATSWRALLGCWSEAVVDRTTPPQNGLLPSVHCAIGLAAAGHARTTRLLPPSKRATSGQQLSAATGGVPV